MAPYTMFSGERKFGRVGLPRECFRQIEPLFPIIRSFAIISRMFCIARDRLSCIEMLVRPCSCAGVLKGKFKFFELLWKSKSTQVAIVKYNLLSIYNNYFILRLKCIIYTFKKLKLAHFFIEIYLKLYTKNYLKIKILLTDICKF